MAEPVAALTADVMPPPVKDAMAEIVSPAMLVPMTVPSSGSNEQQVRADFSQGRAVQLGDGDLQHDLMHAGHCQQVNDLRRAGGAAGDVRWAGGRGNWQDSISRCDGRI